jgi:hypothetical protein
MTTLHLHDAQKNPEKTGRDRRKHRRHDLEHQSIGMERWTGEKQGAAKLGKIMDISAGGVRVRTEQSNVQPDNQIRVRLELPTYAGICPFVDTSSGEMQPRKDWVGWMTVARVKPVSEREFDVAGQLVDMEDIDRGMLKLYLSTQPLAA